MPTLSPPALDAGVIYCDDNLDRLTQMPSESVDLVYLDPPFFSNRTYEVIWGDEAEVRSFEDRWDGGMQHYVGWMRPRVMELHRVLKPTGSFYLHCDPHASHYLKTMLDDVFGMDRFVNEVIWKRSTAHSDTRQGAKHMGRLHDTVLLYAKSQSYTFNTQLTPYDEAYIASKYRYVEQTSGRRYRLDNLTGPGGAAKGNPQYEVMGVTRYWRYSRERMAELVEAGRVIQTRPGTVPQYKRYLDEMPGVPVQDVWTDIDPINSRARERLGYPTQKPEALLARIIATSTNPGDVVLDPFCGCGTTISVAEQMDRRWVGIDISPTAVNLMRRRLLKLTKGACHPTVIGLPASIDELRALKPFEFQNWVIAKVWGTAAPRKTGDMGIDGYSFMVHDPIQVKQSERVGRNVIDNFETAMRRAGKSTGYVIAFSFTRNAREEVARARVQEGLDIALVTIQSLLDAKDEHGPLIPKGATIAQLPLTPPRTGATLPTSQELVTSDRAQATA